MSEIPDTHPLCRTPGTVFHTRITGRYIRAQVDLPEHIVLSPEQAAELDELIRRGLEDALASYFLGPES